MTKPHIERRKETPMTVKWNKSEDSYITSKCGRFEINPVWMGRTTPQAYDLYFCSEPNAPRKRVNRYCSTQRDAKELAESYVEQRCSICGQPASTTAGPAADAICTACETEMLAPL